MKIHINCETIDAPCDIMTLREFLDWHGIEVSGDTVTVNSKPVGRLCWDTLKLSDGDDLTVITGKRINA